MSRHALGASVLIALTLSLSPLRGDPPVTSAAAKPPAAWQKPEPADLQDLKQIESHLRDLLPAVQAATVHLQLGFINGSGVIISDEGYVLTAAHVSSPAGRNVLITFANGKQVHGKTLGWYKEADA